MEGYFDEYIQKDHHNFFRRVKKNPWEIMHQYIISLNDLSLIMKHSYPTIFWRQIPVHGVATLGFSMDKELQDPEVS